MTVIDGHDLGEECRRVAVLRARQDLDRPGHGAVGGVGAGQSAAAPVYAVAPIGEPVGLTISRTATRLPGSTRPANTACCSVIPAVPGPKLPDVAVCSMRSVLPISEAGSAGLVRTLMATLQCVVAVDDVVVATTFDQVVAATTEEDVALGPDAARLRPAEFRRSRQLGIDFMTDAPMTSASDDGKRR